MPTANEELQDALIRRQTFLLRYSGTVRNQVIKFLNDNEEAIVNIILSRLSKNEGLVSQIEFRRLRRTIEAIDKSRSAVWQAVEAYLVDEMKDLAIAEGVSIQNMFATVSPVLLDTVLPGNNQLRAIATSQPFQGKVLRNWAKDMADADLTRIHGAIQMGMVAGESSQQIARRVVGTKALKGRDGVTQTTRRNAQAVTRTAVMHVANSARKMFMAENAEVLNGEIYVATLDSRTTPVCRANDGKRFEVGKGPQPPLHFNCRSTRIAVLDRDELPKRPMKPTTERGLLREYTQRNNLATVTKRGDLPRGHKGSFDTFSRRRVRELVGVAPPDTTYQVWLQRQSAQFQTDLLGPTKAKLFRDGDLQLDRFVNRNGDELTLSELATRERDAFIAAGLDPDAF